MFGGHILECRGNTSKDHTTLPPETLAMDFEIVEALPQFERHAIPLITFASDLTMSLNFERTWHSTPCRTQYLTTAEPTVLT